MAQYQDSYGQYSDSGHQSQYSGLNIEDQSAAPTAEGPWPSSGAAGYGDQPSWANTATGGDAAARAPYSAPPVQPMYANDPQYQQGGQFVVVLIYMDLFIVSQY